MKGILIVSHGTLDQEAKARSLDLLYEENKQRAVIVLACFVSKKTIVGNNMLSLDEAMKKMLELGVDDLHIYNTFVIPGDIYHHFLTTIIPYEAFFKRFVIEKPLLHENSDFSSLARMLTREYAIKPNQTYLLVGHGSSPHTNKLYAFLEAAFMKQQTTNVHLVLMHGHPSIDDLMPTLHTKQKIILLPLMMSAGHHVAHDVKQFKKSSIETKLLEHGFEVEVIDKGLAEYRTIRDYIMHNEKTSI
ncbi:MAG TPA: hypothetical protein DDW57_07330 [Erysipelotrichaceae bacterium]|nr:hypothetical protein [Erysipelotrichaceae bacterium]